MNTQKFTGSLMFTIGIVTYVNAMVGNVPHPVAYLGIALFCVGFTAAISDESL